MKAKTKVVTATKKAKVTTKKTEVKKAVAAVKKDRVLIGIATGPYVVAKFAFALTDLVTHPSEHYECCGIASYQSVMVDDARNKIVEDFLKTPCEWLLMLDTDTVFQAEVIDQLLEMHRTMGTKVGCGWYNILKAEGGVRPAIFEYSPDGLTSRCPIITPDSPAYFPADLGPSGAMLVHREVYEKIKATGETYYFKFAHLGKGSTISEDVHFCKLIKKLGYKFMVCRDARMLHYKLLSI
jgi:GT2 family glycosyltransferase